MAGLSQGSEAAVAASPKPAVAASPEDLASLRVSQPLKLSNVPLKWIRDSCEDPGSHRGEAIVAAVAAEGTEGAHDDGAGEANVAAVAAGDAEAGDGDVSSEVSSEVFVPPRHGGPVETADMMDDEEFMDTHGGGATPLVADDRGRWNAAERRVLAAAGDGPLVQAPRDDAVAAEDYGVEELGDYNENWGRSRA